MLNDSVMKIVVCAVVDCCLSDIDVGNQLAWRLRCIRFVGQPV